MIGYDVFSRRCTVPFNLGGGLVDGRRGGRTKRPRRQGLLETPPGGRETSQTGNNKSLHPNISE